MVFQTASILNCNCPGLVKFYGNGVGRVAYTEGNGEGGVIKWWSISSRMLCNTFFLSYSVHGLESVHGNQPMNYYVVFSATAKRTNY